MKKTIISKLAIIMAVVMLFAVSSIATFAANTVNGTGYTGGGTNKKPLAVDWKLNGDDHFPVKDDVHVLLKLPNGYTLNLNVTGRIIEKDNSASSFSFTSIANKISEQKNAQSMSAKKAYGTFKVTSADYGNFNSGEKVVTYAGG
jgi:hypothetical protein